MRQSRWMSGITRQGWFLWALVAGVCVVVAALLVPAFLR